MFALFCQLGGGGKGEEEGDSVARRTNKSYHILRPHPHQKTLSSSLASQRTIIWTCSADHSISKQIHRGQHKGHDLTTPCRWPPRL